MNNYISFFLATILLPLLTSCASIQNSYNSTLYWQPYQNQKIAFYATGRISVKVDKKGSHGNFDWNSQNSKLNMININTPMGNTIGQLCKDKLGVVAQNNKGETFWGKTSTELSQNLLGYPIPVDYLDYWVNGYIPTDIPYTVNGNQLKQAGWTIERILNKNNSPKKVILKKRDLNIVIIFDSLNRDKIIQYNHQCPARNKLL